MDIVKVKCIDMCYHTGTWARRDIKELGLIDLEVVGWLVEDRKDCVVIAKEHMPEDDQFRHVSVIPKVCIKGKLEKIKM